jgi:hypothetical protein
LSGEHNDEEERPHSLLSTRQARSNRRCRYKLVVVRAVLDAQGSSRKTVVTSDRTAAAIWTLSWFVLVNSATTRPVAPMICIVLVFVRQKGPLRTRVVLSVFRSKKAATSSSHSVTHVAPRALDALLGARWTHRVLSASASRRGSWPSQLRVRRTKRWAGSLPRAESGSRTRR